MAEWSSDSHAIVDALELIIVSISLLFHVYFLYLSIPALYHAKKLHKISTRHSQGKNKKNNNFEFTQKKNVFVGFVLKLWANILIFANISFFGIVGVDWEDSNFQNDENKCTTWNQQNTKKKLEVFHFGNSKTLIVLGHRSFLFFLGFGKNSYYCS